MYLDYFAGKLVTNRKGSLSKFRTASCIHQNLVMKTKVSREKFRTSSEKIRILIMLRKNLSPLRKRFVSLLFLREITYLVGKDLYIYYFT